MQLLEKIKLISYRLVALFILKLTYSRAFQLLLCLSGATCLILFVSTLKLTYFLSFLLLIIPLVGALLMKPYDNIIVISRITGSPHVLIKNRMAINMCFDGKRLNALLLLKTIKRSMYNYLYDYAYHSKRKYITTKTHKVMFRTLGLEKFDFIKDIKEIGSGVIRDKLIFVSFKEIMRKDDLSDLSKKVQYYKFKIDLDLLREYLDENPDIRDKYH